ncbi:MAG TPA: isocitrate lyase/phosphoenolpyruvate mutase family protein [Ktedonobacteraceae bacterium]|nr:isocitrate lyase/phosphoenolpyruvate mutase family protein [Ktedonobacteraceae bacterium]
MTLRYKVLPDDRRPLLKKILQDGSGIRIVEAHNGLSALVASTASYCGEDARNMHFDGLWVSSLTSSAAQGLPDCELNNIERRLETIEEVCNATDKFVIVDGDTGGEPINFQYFCNRLEMMGISAIVVEDKEYPKRNSLSTHATHHLEDPHVFAQKIRQGKDVLLSNDFMIFARLESLIAGAGVEDALMRARIYLEADVDGIMIHSKKRTTDEVYAFLCGYEEICRELNTRKPVICVPTTYNAVTDEELFQHGVNIVIHANHLLRAAYSAMQKVCQTILQNDRNLEAEELCVPVPTLFDIVGFDDVVAKTASVR